jgi:signal transduction histidine kinase/DNA-binding response OmpR family regulator
MLTPIRFHRQTEGSSIDLNPADNTQNMDLAYLDSLKLPIHEKQLRTQYVAAVLTNRIMQVMMEDSDPIRFFRAIEELLGFTASRFGFVGYLFSDQKMILLRKTFGEAMKSDDSDRCTLPADIWYTLCAMGKKKQDSGDFKTISNLLSGNPEIENFIIIHIRFRYETIAVFCAANKTRGYSDTDKELFDTIAHAVAPVIYAFKQQRFREEEQTKRELYQKESMARIRLLSQTADQLLRGIHLDDVIDSICKSVIEYLDFESFLFFRISEHSDQLELCKSFGISDSNGVKDYCHKFGMYVITEAKKSRSSIIIASGKSGDSEKKQLLDILSVKSYVIMSLAGSDEHIVGMIIFLCKENDPVKNENLILLRTITNQISIAQERTKKEQKLRGYQKHLKQMIEEQTAELQKNQEKLAHSQKMEALGLLAGGIAHDFNNMIQVITGITHHSLKKEPLNDSLRSNIRLIDTTAWSAASLTRRLLAFSRKQVLQKTIFALDTLLMKLKPAIEPLVGTNVTVVYTIRKEGVYIEADFASIEQAVMDIVLFATNAMSQGGTLFLEMKEVVLGENSGKLQAPLPWGTYVNLSITDTGGGFKEEELKRIFEPFFTTGRFSDGAGLRLSSAYGTIQQSGGTVQVYSSPGTGTTFKIFLPVSCKSPVHSITGDTPLYVNKKFNETVLVVDDSKYALEFIACELNDIGYHVLTAECSEDALEIAENYSSKIDLLITDVILPGLNGWELSLILLSKRPVIKTLYISGYDHDQIVKTGKIRIDAGFLAKPFSPEQLSVKIREVLDRKPDTTENDRYSSEDSCIENKKRVLIVDDLPGVAQAFAVVLENARLDIRTAEDGKKTLETAMDFKPDVVVLDLNLPDMDGEEVAQELRKSDHCSDCFIIAASGFEIGESENVGLFNACIVKPIDLKKLEVLIMDAPLKRTIK